MGGPASSPHGSSSPMEHGQLHPVLLGHLHELLLRLVELPRSRESPRVLAGVGVPDHDFLLPVNPVPVPVNGEEPGNRGGGGFEVSELLEQRDDPEGLLDAALALEELDGQDVGRGGGHGDDVGAEVVGGEVRDDVERFQDVGDFLGLGEVGAEQRALASELGKKPFLSLLLGPVAIGSDAQVLCYRVHDVGVAL